MNDALLSWAWTQGDTTTQRIVLIVLSSYADDKLETAISVGLIKARAALSKQGVLNTLKRLESEGLITQLKKGNGREPSRYLINAEGSTSYTPGVKLLYPRGQAGVPQGSTSFTPAVTEGSTSFTPQDQENHPSSSYKKETIETLVTKKKYRKLFEILCEMPELFTLDKKSVDDLIDHIERNEYSDVLFLENTARDLRDLTVSYKDRSGKMVRRYKNKRGKWQVYRTIKTFRDWLKRDWNKWNETDKSSEPVTDVNKYQDQAERFGGS